MHLTVDLKLSTQCQLEYSRANEVICMTGTADSYTGCKVILHLYKSLPRPYLEFCAYYLIPYYNKNKQLLKLVEHHFAK